MADQRKTTADVSSGQSAPRPASSGKPPRALQELNLIDDFLFQEMLASQETGEKFARLLLGTFLGKPVRNVRIISQKTIPGIDTAARGIRLDAYIEAVPDEPVPGQEMYDVTIRPDLYDIEPDRTYERSSLPRRMRYYHALIDTRILSVSTDYQSLQNVTIFIILPYDPFGKKRMVYTVRNRCLEDDRIPYEDGTTKIFFYTKGTEGNPGQELCDMLKYIEHSTTDNVTNQTIDELDRLVSTVKQSREAGINYMKSWEHEKIIRDEERRIGIEQGTRFGIEQGIRAFISFCQELSFPRSEAAERLADKFDLSTEKAAEYLELFWPLS